MISHKCFFTKQRHKVPRALTTTKPFTTNSKNKLPAYFATHPLPGCILSSPFFPDSSPPDHLGDVPLLRDHVLSVQQHCHAWRPGGRDLVLPYTPPSRRRRSSSSSSRFLLLSLVPPQVLLRGGEISPSGGVEQSESGCFSDFPRSGGGSWGQEVPVPEREEHAQNVLGPALIPVGVYL